MTDQPQQNHSKELGILLSQSRERLGLTQKEVATKLNLNERVIVALDNSEFSDLPAPIYVRGYIRSYARIVGIKEDDVIGVYNSSEEIKLPEILPDVKPVTQGNNKINPLQMLLYLTTFSVALLSIIAWQGKNIIHTSHASNSDDVAVPADQTLQKISIPQKGSGPHTGLAELNIKLTGECWVKIYDAGNKVIHNSLAKYGEKINLTEQLPLSVRLSNAQAVMISLNKKPLDIASYTARNDAYFRLE